jgi:hypothetical protein
MIANLIGFEASPGLPIGLAQVGIEPFPHLERRTGLR